MMRTVTAAWLPGSRPKATPRLRVLTSCTPGRKRCSEPRSIACSTMRLLAWSASSTPAVTSPASPHARLRTCAASRTATSAVDHAFDDDAVEDRERDDRDHGAEVEG